MSQNSYSKANLQVGCSWHSPGRSAALFGRGQDPRGVQRAARYRKGGRAVAVDAQGSAALCCGVPANAAPPMR